MKVIIKENKLISDNWYKLYKVTYEYPLENGDYQTQIREVYNRGNGATVLLYNSTTKNIILTKQFRMPTFLNGNDDGMMIEACAGMLDEDDPAECIKREALEETGYKVQNVHKIFEAYMSPGAITEIVHFFVAKYSDDMKISEGGGLDDEQEHIEVLEMKFETAYKMIATGEIKDAKTILLLQHAKLKNLID